MFRLEVGAQVRAQAEIEEVLWSTPAEAAALGDRLAPLARLLLDPAPDTGRPRRG